MSELQRARDRRPEEVHFDLSPSGDVRPAKGSGRARLGDPKAVWRQLLGAPRIVWLQTDHFQALSVEYDLHGSSRAVRFHGGSGARPHLQGLSLLGAGAERVLAALSLQFGAPHNERDSHFLFDTVGYVLWRGGSRAPHFDMFEARSGSAPVDSDSPMTSADLQRLLDDPLVSEIQLNGPRVTDQTLDGARAPRNARALDLSGSRVTDAGLRHLSAGPLEHLDLDETAVSDAGLAALRRFERLSSLDLYGTRVTGEGLGALLHLPLRLLGLSRTRITPSAIPIVTSFTNLEVLELAETQIGDESCAALAALTRLKRLEVREARFTPEGVAALRERLPGCYVEAE